ncbi:hypothetical protein GGF42_000479, partial [Coemansia sp. RSA 2424]
SRSSSSSGTITPTSTAPPLSCPTLPAWPLATTSPLALLLLLPVLPPPMLLPPPLPPPLLPLPPSPTSPL